MSRCPAPFALPCPMCHVSDTLLEVVFTGKKIMILAGYCPTCHSVWHSVYQRQTGEVTHYPVTFCVWSPRKEEDTSC
jgi:Zn-finger nucleic acid-binding protein